MTAVLRHRTPSCSALVALLALAAVSACASDDPLVDDDSSATESGWHGELPPGFPTPLVPVNNPMTPEKIELGRHLFYDTRMSGNDTQSCASCHFQELAFADGLATPEGSTGEPHPRNSLALVNTAYNSTYTWANPALATLEQQIAVPLFGEFPVELGATGNEDLILSRLRDDPVYRQLFADAFPDRSDPISIDAAIDAVASFVRSMISGDSPFDRFVYGGQTDALSPSARRGMELFYSELLECHHCHGGFNFSFSTASENSTVVEIAFHNTGLYNIDGEGAYPTSNTGLYEVTGDPADMGAFRAPTLRNVAVTAPYMHDGSMLTLEEVVRFYEEGGRLIEDGPYAGDGRASPLKNGFISGFQLNPIDRMDLIAFLESLTDETFLTNPAYSNPWPDAAAEE